MLRTIAVIGAGAWGTALATSLQRAGNQVIIWAREPEVVGGINTRHENTVFLPGKALDASITATSNLENVISQECLCIVSPAQFTRSTCQQLKQVGLPETTPLILCCKGVEQSTLKLMTEVVAEELPNPIAVLSGPTFASEVAQGLPASVTLACTNDNLLQNLKKSIEHTDFKVFITNDIIGAEIGGAVKNVIAIACGIAEGSGLGENAKAALMVRGIREMKRICEAKGGQPDTLMQLCGIGDLILTASSQESRNFSLGYALGQGKSLEIIMAQRVTVAEGVASSESVVNLAHALHVEVPICDAVNRIVHGQEDIRTTIEHLIRDS